MSGRRRPSRSTIARQVLALGAVLCAVALTLAYPVRNYLEQRASYNVVVAEQQALEAEVAALEAQRDALDDPDYIAAEAKRRLSYVMPGDRVYRVIVPAGAASSPASGAEQQAAQPWYNQVWEVVTAPAAG